MLKMSYNFTTHGQVIMQSLQCNPWYLPASPIGTPNIVCIEVAGNDAGLTEMVNYIYCMVSSDPLAEL